MVAHIGCSKLEKQHELQLGSVMLLLLLTTLHSNRLESSSSVKLATR